jgi:hypothetical protein
VFSQSYDSHRKSINPPINSDFFPTSPLNYNFNKM